ncbi:MAG: site-specific DNA-methyltransferase, partial [Chloroflexi bacterium]|nr:site-specific DNA-methyltransferase [Chloroflexota bacterium]
LVLDPFSGSGTTGIAALKLNCSFLGFEIDNDQVVASNKRLHTLRQRQLKLPVA